MKIATVHYNLHGVVVQHHEFSSAQAIRVIDEEGRYVEVSIKDGKLQVYDGIAHCPVADVYDAMGERPKPAQVSVGHR